MDKYGLKKNILFRSTIKLYGYTINGSKYDCKADCDLYKFYSDIIRVVEVYNPDDVIACVHNISKYYNFNLDSLCYNPNFLNIFDSASMFCSYFLMYCVGDECIIRIIAHFLDASSVCCPNDGGVALPLDVGFKDLEYYMNVRTSALQLAKNKYDRLNGIINATNDFYIYGFGYMESDFSYYIKNNIHLIIDILSFTHLVVIHPVTHKDIYIYFNSHKGQKRLISRHPLIAKTIYSVPTYHNHDSSAPSLSDYYLQHHHFDFLTKK